MALTLWPRGLRLLSTRAAFLAACAAAACAPVAPNEAGLAGGLTSEGVQPGEAAPAPAVTDAGEASDPGQPNATAADANANVNADANAGVVGATDPNDAGAVNGLAPMNAMGRGPTNMGTFTPLAMVLVPASAAIEAELLLKAGGNTTSAITPMGEKFVAAAAKATTNAQRTLLLSGQVAPFIPANLGLSWKRFAVTLYTEAGPSPADIYQHGVGTCGGIAALGGLAMQNPDFVRSRIVQKNSTTFLVHMYDPQGLPVDVTVQNLFLADAGGSLMNVSGANGQANWVTVLEKATMVYNSIFAVLDDGQTSVGGIGGIGAEHQMPLFTGNGQSIGYGSGTLSPPALRVAVARAMVSGDVVTGGFLRDTTVASFNVFALHAYTVSGVGSNAAAVMQMRNPWGCAPATKTGICDPKLSGVSTIGTKDATLPLIDIRIIAPGAAFGGSHTLPMTN